MADASAPRLYTGHLTNTAPWRHFRLREDDVVVATPPKCGTTWTQAIVCTLIHGSPDLPDRLGELAPWLDCAFKDQVALAAVLDAQTHRRCIKSHAPLDGIKWDPRVAYFGVYRHPVDAHFSMRKHVEKAKPGAMAEVRARYPEDVGRAFEMFVEDPSPDGTADDMSLDGIVRHYRSFLAAADRPNVHLLHYADLTRDLAGQIKRVAEILGITHAPEVMDRIVEGARFENMKSDESKSPASRVGTIFREGENFFDSGTSRKWEGQISETRMARYRERLASLLPGAEARWLEEGGPPP